MKKLLSAIVALSVLTFGPPAIAADMAVKAWPVAPLAPAIWSGFYVGGQAGYTWANADYTHTNTSGFVESFSFHPDSAIGGAHAGVQGQWGNWVLGVEGSFNFARLYENRTSLLRPPSYKTFELNDIGTFVGKVGYAANNWLIYMKGGWADANIRTEGTNPLNGSTASPQKWQSGWTLGGGVDYLVATSWILGVDFNYYHIDFDRSAIASSGGITTWSNASADVYAVMGRISYKFGL
ncbi:MAG TPA: outer membrane beta-barrel protein [Xanthobacteraceae bacterium]|jgi:outer membrane immunogenic protein|nr:outer membrane beta-barrel protein [Xanthobacteraceae bacterium]